MCETVLRSLRNSNYIFSQFLISAVLNTTFCKKKRKKKEGDSFLEGPSSKRKQINIIRIWQMSEEEDRIITNLQKGFKLLTLVFRSQSVNISSIVKWKRKQMYYWKYSGEYKLGYKKQCKKSTFIKTTKQTHKYKILME